MEAAGDECVRPARDPPTEASPAWASEVDPLFSERVAREARGVDVPVSSEAAGPAEPPEPVVSATATAGNAANAAPTPRATASAPTRPTQRSKLKAGAFAAFRAGC